MGRLSSTEWSLLNGPGTWLRPVEGSGCVPTPPSRQPIG